MLEVVGVWEEEADSPLAAGLDLEEEIGGCLGMERWSSWDLERRF